MTAERKILRDQRGAIMVMGVFMAALLVGFLYYAIGTAEAVLARERMQDAADSAAFSAAVVHARGMNIIALINMVMAAVLAVLVALKVTETIIIIGIAIAAALSWCCGTGALIAPLNQARQIVHEAFEEAKPIVYAVLRAGNKASTAIKVAAPVAAQAKVMDTVLATYNPPAKFGFAWPIYRELPVEDGCFSELCGKAGEYAGQLVAAPLAAIPGGGWLAGKLGGAIGGLTRRFSGYFCGSGGVGECESSEDLEPPTFSQETEVYYPESPEARRCRQDAGKYADDCEAAAAQEDAVCLARDPTTNQCIERSDAPDATTGECTNPQCSLRAAEASSQCRPRDGLSEYEWQLCVMEVEVCNNGGVPSYSSPVKKECFKKGPGGPPPCGNAGWTEWGTGTFVCEQKHSFPDPLTLPPGKCFDPPPTFEAVTAVYACKGEETVSVTMDDKLDLGGGDGSDMAPKRMKQDGIYDLGESGLQLKVVVIGDPTKAYEKGEKGVKVATWGQDTDDPYGRLRDLGRLSLAQAEYYFDCSGGDECNRDEWLWHMYWRARLRRFRISDGDGSAEDACSGQETTGCEAGGFLDSVAGPLNGLIIH